jgi:bacterioferritin-associated ferredoxin
MLVCHCKGVNCAKIKKEIHQGAWTLEDLIKRTGCCTGCGSCEELVQDILDKEGILVEDYLENHPARATE